MIRFLKNTDGVAATEFALIAPILIFMVVSMIDFGMFINTSMRLESTSMAAAQYIIQGGDAEDIEDDIILAGNLGLDADTVDSVDVDIQYIYECEDGIAVESDEVCDEDGDYLREYVQVTISATYNAIMPLPNFLSTLDISQSVRLQKG